MKKHDDETMYGFNRRFASFYYSMPKEIQPLEGTAKMHYGFVLSPELSLLLLERRPVTLQRMFVNALEFKYNLRMSEKLSDQGGDDKVEKYLRLNEQCGRIASLSDVVFYGREKGQTNDMQGRDCNPLF